MCRDKLQVEPFLILLVDEMLMESYQCAILVVFLNRMTSHKVV